MPSRATWVKVLAPIAVGAWVYVAFKVGERIYGVPDLSACGGAEDAVGCARLWLSAAGPALIGIAMLEFLRRQTRIAARQIEVCERLREIAETQQKASLLKELSERRTEIEGVCDRIGREFMMLQSTGDLAVARSIVIELENLIESAAFLNFTPPELRVAFRKLLETIRARHAMGSLDLKKVPIERLLDRLFERSLEAQDGWEAAYEELIGQPIARPARERLQKWRVDKAAIAPKSKVARIVPRS